MREGQRLCCVLVLLAVRLLEAAPALAADPKQSGASPKGASASKQGGFDSLPADHVLQVGNRRMSKAEFMTLMQKVNRNVVTKSVAPAFKAGLDPEWATRLESNNAAVRSEFNRLPALVMADPKTQIPLDARPQIDRIGGRPPLSPGEFFYVVGSFFGEAKGSVRLHGASFPGGDFAAEVVVWTPKAILAQVHDDISGAPDQPLKVYVRKPNGKRSVDFVTSFEAARVWEMLDPAFIGRHCVTNSADLCRISDSLSIEALHYSYKYDTGADGFTVNLINGWKILRVSLLKRSCGMGVLDPSRYQAAAALRPYQPTDPTVFIDWWYTREDAMGGGLCYQIQFQGVGPRGLPSHAKFGHNP